MSFTSRRLRHWQFSVGVMAPAVLLLVLAAAAVTGFVLWSTSSIDQHEIQQQSALAAHAIERQIAEIPYAQQSVAIWDDAIIYSKLQFARGWLDNNVGVWMNEYYGYEATAIISDADRPIYAAVGSRSEAFDYIEARWEAIRPLVAQLRREIAGGALARYESGETTVYPSAVETKVVAGVPAVISVVPITSQTGAIAQPAGTEYLHVAIEYLDADFARTLSDNYHFENARFTLQPDAQAGFASLPVFGRDGRVTAIFEWQPNRPGWRLLTQTGPVLGLAFLAAAVLVVVLVNRLWASNAALEAERIEARHQATHDPLTGLANRVQFDHQLARDLGERRLRVPVALLMLDLDRFKHVNDTLGHDAGDDLINAVGQRLRQLIGPADVLARLGGDEFAIIHPCREGEEGALRLANRIVDALAKPFDLSHGEAFIGVSIGLVIAGPEDRE
ncbi:MAG TPA: diguanylate cyclase, partial [Alphaproteobacteria bacterium]|nr:diguanylate cyclase [Alphaproteobacteria bacterium]